MSDHPAITDADRDCARLILEYVASVTDPRGMVERQLQIFREREVHLALEAERMRDNRVYRAIKELLHASTPADRANLAAGLLVALDKLAENQTDHVVDANKMAASEQAADHFADAGKMVEKTEAKP